MPQFQPGMHVRLSPTGRHLRVKIQEGVVVQVVHFRRKKTRLLIRDNASGEQFWYRDWWWEPEESAP